MKNQYDVIVAKKGLNDSNNAYNTLTGNYDGTENNVIAPGNLWERYLFNKNYVKLKTTVNNVEYTKKIKGLDVEPAGNTTGFTIV